MCQQIPLGPSEASTITQLETRKQDLGQQVEALHAKVVLRPEPSQYGPLQHEVAQFLGSLGSINRILALCSSIKVRQSMLMRQLPPLYSMPVLDAPHLLAICHEQSTLSI